jgi:hypothetical protein
MTHYTASETLYMTADRRRVVREGDPAASSPGASRLVFEGNTLPASTVARFGLRTVGCMIVGTGQEAEASEAAPIVEPLAEPIVEKAIEPDDPAIENKVITPQSASPATATRKRRSS